MISTMTEMELQLLISARSTLDRVVKTAKDQVSGLGDEAEKAGKKATKGFKPLESQLYQTIKPLTQMRRVFGAMRYTVLLFVGEAIRELMALSKTYEELIVLSAKYNMTLKEAGAKFKGIVISDADIRTMEQLQINLSLVGKAAGEAAYEIQKFYANYYNWAVKTTGEGINNVIALTAAWKKFTEELRKGVIPKESVAEYAAKELKKIQEFNKGADEVAKLEAKNKKNKEEAQALQISQTKELMRLKGEDIKLLRYEQAETARMMDMLGIKGKEAIDTWNQIKKIQEENLKASYWGFKGYYQALADMRKEFAQQTSQVFTDLFVDLLDNRLKSGKEIFRKFILDIRNMIIKFMMERLVLQFMTGLFPDAGGGGGVPKGKGGAGSSGFWGGVAGVGTMALMALAFQRGGWANRPTFGKLGEQEPELVVPKSKLGQLGTGTYGMGGGSGQETYVYINAVDSKSFVEMLNRNPDAITTIVHKSMDRNQSIRHRIRSER